MQGHICEVTPTISTGAYTAADQVGGIQTITGVNSAGRELSLLRSVVVVDEAAQKAPLTILLFDELPTVASADKDAVNVADAQLTGKCIGVVEIVADDYVDVAAGSVACVRLELPVKPVGVASTIYAVVSTSGTPDYGAADDLTFKYAFQW